MFRITAETCRAFAVEEILILAAMNVEAIRLASGGCIRRRLREHREDVSLLVTLFV
jgi:hypothetical protein